MSQIAFSYYKDVYLVLIAFLIFLGAFIFLFMSTYSKANRKLYKELEQLPLEEDGDRK